MAFEPTVDFNYFLQRKYALLQQQADAGDVQAQSGRIQANTGALVGAAGAKLDTTRANLLPAESASQIALQGAQTGLVRNQASVVIPTAQSQIDVNSAGINATNVGAAVQARDGLLEQTALGSRMSSLMPQGYTGYRLPTMSSVSPSYSTPGLERGVRVRRGSF